MKIVGLGCVFIATTGVVFAQSDLKQVRLKMSDSIGRSVDFVCSANMQRFVHAGSGEPTPFKAIRLDAGVVNGREVFAYPTSDDDTEALSGMLGEYARTGTGAFAVYARPLFLTTAATFFGAPEVDVAGKKMGQWEFTMPKETSKLAVAVAGKGVPVGYTGVMMVDPANSDVMQIEIRPDQPPAESGMKNVTHTLTFHRAKIANLDLNLPASSELVVEEVGGRKFRVVAKYDNCRRYNSDSGIRFLTGIKEQTVAQSVATSGGPVLAVKEQLDLNLEDPIDEKTTSVGTRLVFKTNRPIKDGSNVLVPKGATAIGEVTRVSRQTYRHNESWLNYFIIGIRLVEIDGGGTKYSVVANLERIGPTQIISTFIPYSQDPDKWGVHRDVRDLMTWPAHEPGESILGVVRQYLRVPPKLRFVFSTQAR